MRIVIAPDSFKGSLTAPEVCRAIEAGIRTVLPDVEAILVPMADGGDGTARTLAEGTGGRLLAATVTGPLGGPVRAEYGVLGDGETAVIEMAAASGLTLVPPERRNPLHTTTRGTGELMAAALDRGCRKLIVGLGGSATTDGGLGMAQALGARCLNARGEPVAGTGEGLSDLERIDVSGLDPRLAEAQVRVACDVDNPLYGERGAAAVYGPQKGATPEMVTRLDAGLRRFAEVVERDLGMSVADLPGAGAAGGLGAGLVAFCGATLEPGVGIVLEAVGLEEKLQGAEAVFTGEGRIDFQTAFGKAPAGVATLARKHGCAVFALGGSVALEARALHERGFTALRSIVNAPLSLAEAMQPERAAALTAFAAEEMLRAYLAGVVRGVVASPPGPLS
ncbi:MAG: glycerate kinase [Armatimonadetes bacterium]|nr:glycerate kinase [Armatimonadota bacterium]